jgi:hypothetical protein
LFFLVSSLIPGIHSVYSQHFVFDVDHSRQEQISLLLSVFFCFGSAYGLHRRALIVWKLGPWFIGLICLDWVAESLATAQGLPKAWIASVAIVIGGLAVAAYWLFWWKRQKSYFIRKP